VEARSRDLTRRELLGSAAALGLAAAAPELATDRAAAAVTPPLSAPANVLVVVVDSLRKDHVGAYGGRARTPTFDALARESLVFDHARHESMPTVPVRRALMTGRRGFPFRGWRPERGLPAQPGWESVHPGEDMWTDVLARRGYLTGYVTDNPHVLRPAFGSFRSRFDVTTTVAGQIPGFHLRRRRVSSARLRRHLPPELHGVGRGRVREYLAYNPAGRDERDYLGARVVHGGIDFLERAAFERRPFALVVDCFDVHEPWDPPDRYLAAYARVRRGGYRPIQPFPTPVGRVSDISRRTFALARRMYAAEVTFLDAWLGLLLRRLDELGLSNTWVVAMSDHGVALGERGLIGKTSDELHRELIDVPFMVRHPRRVGAGRRSGYFASAHDVGPTLLRAVGAPVPRSMDGADLTPLLRGRRARERPVWTSAWNDKLLAGDGRWLLVVDNDDRRLRNPRLHDTRRDPGEHRDLAGRRPDVVRRLRDALWAAAGKRGFPPL
jgi:arylsulfatase A-like enzyme